MSSSNPLLSSLPLLNRLYPLFPWFVLLGTLGITAVAWNLTSAQANIEAHKEFTTRASQLETTIQSRMKAYEQILHGAKGLFAASTKVERQEWHNYVAAQHLDENYPGVLALAYAAYIPPDQLAEHERLIRGQGFPNYAVWPKKPRAEYSSIVYIEPFSGRNLRAFGYDMLSEPVRHKAMDRARRTGMAALSGKVRLVQEGSGRGQAGSLLYLPIYRNTAPTDSEASRMQALQGWAYEPFRMDDLMYGLLPDGHLDLDIELYDGSLTADRLLYPAEPMTRGAGAPPRFSDVVNIPLYGQKWLMKVTSTPAFEQRMATDRPTIVAAGGSLISLLCFAFTWSLARTRTRAIQLAGGMTIELSESEQRFRNMFENSPIAYQSLDLSGRYLDVNDHLCNLLGYSREELLGRNFAEFWPEHQRPHYKGICDALKHAGNIDTELQLLRKNGETITVILVGKVQRDHNGEFVRTHCILTDISSRKRMEEELQRSQAKLNEAIKAGNVGLWEWNLETNEVFYSTEYKQQIGYADDEISNTYEEWASRLHPDDLPVALKAIEEHNKDPEKCPYLVEFRFRHKNGSYRWIQARGMAVFDENGKPVRMLGSHTDITERHEKDEMLRLSSVVFESAEEGIVVTDVENRIVMINPAFTAITGYTAEEAIGHNPSIMSSGQHDQHFYQSIWKALGSQGGWHGEIANRHKNGKLYLEWLSIRAVFDQRNELTHYIGIFSDITERKEGEERMRYLAHYDALTGLPNRTLLLDRMQQALAQARRDHGRLAVLFLDLDRFKGVNDTLGHSVGDRLLCEVAKRILGCVRESDTVARLGGDEFIVLLHRLEDQKDAALVAHKIIAELERPFQLGEHTVSISTSIGIALYPEHSHDESILLKLADIAMYQSKSGKSGNYRVYDPAIPEEYDRLR